MRNEVESDSIGHYYPSLRHTLASPRCRPHRPPHSFRLVSFLLLLLLLLLLMLLLVLLETFVGAISSRLSLLQLLYSTIVIDLLMSCSQSILCADGDGMRLRLSSTKEKSFLNFEMHLRRTWLR